MKRKAAFVVFLLVLVSLIAFSNKCKSLCDGKKLIAPEVLAESEAADENDMAGESPLFRLTISL